MDNRNLIALSKFERLLTSTPMHVSRSTFRGGLQKEIHSWFRLTPSFGPQLVAHVLDRFNLQENSHIFDPFAGAGTTLIESALGGHNSHGFEINPLLHFVCKISTNWKVECSRITDSFNHIVETFRSSKIKTKSLQNLVGEGYKIPPIHNPHRWWRDDVLRDLLFLKGIINDLTDDDLKDFFLLAIAAVLVPDLTNVTLGKLQLHFIDRENDDISAIDTFERHCHLMISDLTNIQNSDHALGIVNIHNRSSLEEICHWDTNLIDAVITSPPYVNRYSYVWNTRPHLYFLDFFSTPTEASSLDKKTIGGTWGTATSELSKGEIHSFHAIIEKTVKPFTDDIRLDDNLMANYVMHYFNRLADHFIKMDAILSKTAKIAYVVGNSRIKKRYIPVDLILGAIIEGLGLGYRVTEINRFRRRNSGKDLFETIVYAQK